MMKKEGSESGTGSISQRHGSADPDPHQNVMDSQHCLGHIPSKIFTWLNLCLAVIITLICCKYRHYRYVNNKHLFLDQSNRGAPNKKKIGPLLT